MKDISVRQKIGRVLVILGLSLLFVAYSNFLPTALSSELIADYVKNHFIRQVIFGSTLTALAIKLSLRVETMKQWITLATIGSIVVLPFWIGLSLGWATDGIAEVWGEAINENGAFMLHGPQVSLFYIGLLLMLPTSKNATN